MVTVKRGRLLVLLVAIIAASCDESGRARSGKEGFAYGALLADLSKEWQEQFSQVEPNELFLVFSRPSPIWITPKEMGPSERWQWFKSELPTLSRDTFDDFWARNENPSLPSLEPVERIKLAVRDKGQLLVEYPWIEVPCRERGETDTDWEKRERSWEEKRRRWEERYPRSVLVGFSEMGFSRNRRQGLVYVSFYNWYGAVYLLSKGEDRWHLVKGFVVWVV
jgi:hypothetical protein